MASGDQRSENGGRPEATHEPRECMPCRGSGTVISNLGGNPGTVPCPWCGGGGVRVPEVDAQSAWPANEPPAPKVEPEPAAKA